MTEWQKTWSKWVSVLCIHMLEYIIENNILYKTLLYFFYHAESSVNQCKYFEMGIFSCCRNVVQENAVKCSAVFLPSEMCQIVNRVVAGCAGGEEPPKDLMASSK